MPITLKHENDEIYRLDITGLLTRAEFGQCETELKTEIERVGFVRLLCVLKDFQGWETNADWNNLAFFARHGNMIKRIAIIGNERWRDGALTFAAADLRKAPVKFYPEAQAAQARTWLAE